MQTPKGFTLPELLVVLALITITLTQVSTNLTDTFDQTKLLTIQHELGQQLQLARSEAIKRNRKVTLCKSDLDTQCNTSAEWESGWILFENIDGDGNIDGDDTILTKHHALSSGITVRGVGNFKNRVTYKPTGDSTSFSRLVLCSHNQLNGAQVLYINSTGRIRSALDSDGDGTPEDSNGNNIRSCET